MRTDELIVELARGAGPARPLAAPWARFAKWAAGALVVALLGAVAIGPRADLLAVVHHPAFIWLAALTLATGLFAAASAFVLSVPGAERSPLLRAGAIIACISWALVLVWLVSAGGDALRRVLALPIHVACILEIAAFSVLAGGPLFSMLRRAAPLQRSWSGALATLAAASLGAFATQFICPIDDPAHHLLSHFLPVMFLSGAGALAGRRLLDWLRTVYSTA